MRWRSFGVFFCVLCALPACAVLPDSPALEKTRLLDVAFLTGDAELTGPVSMAEYAMPAEAAAATRSFSGSLVLDSVSKAGALSVLTDDYQRVQSVGDALRHLPPFDFQFALRGHDLLPLQRGVLQSSHPYWEIILQPGKAWNEAGDNGWSRASMPFALQERSANCTHNGVMTWLFGDDGAVSRVVYQVSSETCGYFKFDMWGVTPARFSPQNLSDAADAGFTRLEAHRSRRLPVRPLAQAAIDYPGVDAAGLGVDDGIKPDDISVLGIVVNGMHYRSDCFTRAGPHPYCDSLPLPSYSVAKSIFAGIATMRLEKLFPGIASAGIASLINECSLPRWQDVTLEHALDMATGNFRSPAFGEDEASAANEAFIFSASHDEKLAFACEFFPRRVPPGTQFVYHSSDSYLLGAALASFLKGQRAEADLYRSVLMEPLWQPLGLSPLLDDAKRTYDEYAQPFTGYGLTLEADDVVRLADWLANQSGHIGGEGMLNSALLNAALQRSPDDRGLEAGTPDLRYNNGFWAFDAADSLGCASPVWIPFMSGVSGITVAMFPNGVIYYFFSDGYVFRWQSARDAAHQIAPLCQSAAAFEGAAN